MPIGLLDGFEDYPAKDTLGVGLFTSWIRLAGDRVFLGAGRVGGQRMYFDDDFGSPAVHKTLQPADEFAYFTAIKTTAAFADAGFFMAFCANNSPSTYHLQFGTTILGGLKIFNSAGAVIHIEPDFFIPNTWYSFSIVVKLHASLGIIKIYRNGELVVDIANINTKHATYADVTGVRKQYVSFFGFDDVRYDYDTLVPIPEGRYAQVTYVTDASAQWTRLSGATNFNMIDESTCDLDTTYNVSNTVGHIDRFTVSALPFNPDKIYAVQLALASRKEDVATRRTRCFLNSGAAVFNGADKYETTDYTWQWNILEKNPDGNIDWTKAALALVEPGYELIE